MFSLRNTIRNKILQQSGREGIRIPSFDSRVGGHDDEGTEVRDSEPSASRAAGSGEADDGAVEGLNSINPDDNEDENDVDGDEGEDDDDDDYEDDRNEGLGGESGVPNDQLGLQVSSKVDELMRQYTSVIQGKSNGTTFVGFQRRGQVEGPTEDDEFEFFEDDSEDDKE
ncbi:hypothetical protein HK405_015569 [Cladochytrium tenue]|nr:hypothetical protein HK405_015569 [Cladochytrium tenue]